jgi:HAD superfamily hydrolase (TIGR01490 family)
MADFEPLYSFRASAAFFDLDRTLISGSSAFAFASAAWRNDLVPSRQFVSDALGAAAFKVRGSRDAKVDKVRERVLRAITGNRQADLLSLNAEIIPKLLDRVRPEALVLLDNHRQAGRDTYIVSAAPHEVVEPLASSLGMTGALATVAEVVDGVYTGDLVGPFCYGPGKAEAISDLVAWQGYDLRLCYGYSDSASDLPMLELVGHPVAVNPDNVLRATAQRRGWPIVEFHRRTRTVVKRSTAAAGAVGLAAATYLVGRRQGRTTP